MDSVKHEDAEDKAEDTDDLLCADIDGESGCNFGLCRPSLPRDHCDVLLDSIDAQLSHLQVIQTPCRGQVNRGTCKILDLSASACLDRSHSTSKDTGLGSTDPPTDKTTSTPDGLNSGLPDQSSVTKGRMELNGEQDERNMTCDGRHITTSRQTGRARVPASSRSEQCLWRLELLLGSSTELTVKADDDEDSVRTEDFSARFRDQMLELKDPNPDPDPGGVATDPARDSSDTEPQTVLTHNTTLDPSERSVKVPIRCLAGVPMRSFDSVTIDSDLDSVRTVKVRQHVKNTMNNKTVQQMFQQSGSHARKSSIGNTQQPGNQTLSSDDEMLAREMNGVCVRCTRGLRSPFSIQHREKRSRNKRSISLTSSPSDGMRALEKLRDEVEQAERERHTLQISVTHTRAHTQLLRTELRKLQAQRDLCVKEVRGLQESQAASQGHTGACSHDASTHRNGRSSDTSLYRNAYQYDSSLPKCMSSSCVSVLERQEMDRLLDSTKAELFSEQRRFRHKLDSLQERLEEVSQELELKEEDSRKLKEECSQLEEKLVLAMKQREELQKSVESEREEQKKKLGALKKIVAQRELLLLSMQDEKSCLETELRASKEEHSAKLTAALAQAQKEKEEEVEHLRSQLRVTQEHQLQQTHEATAAALKEQKLTHIRNTESLNKCIQLKEQEVKRLQASLVQLQGALKRREEEMKGETQEQVKRAVAREQRKWEEQRKEALRQQCVKLEEKVQEADKERRRGLVLQNKVLELQTRVTELETEKSAQKDLLRTVRNEHQAETQRLRRQLQQEAECEAVRLQQCVTQSEQELQKLKAALEESERVQQEAAARQEQLNRSWVQDIRTECVNLQELFTYDNQTVDDKHLSHSRVSTVSEAVQELQTLRRPLQQLITTLQNHITMLTHKTQQLISEKESELHAQREQMTAEKEKALNSLKDQLIKEHMEELSTLSRLRLHEDDDGGSVATCLRRQLQAKDEELRLVQRNMALWKEKTTTRLAHKFEEQLTSELERWKVDWLRKRRAPRPESELQRRVMQLEGEMRNLTGNHADVRLPSSSSISLTDFPNTPSSHDLASYKLLRHLQSRIRHLQAENHLHTPGPAHLTPGRESGDLAGSYLETIASTQESRGLRHQSKSPKLTLPNPNC